jgi:hypothetical protein
VSLAAPGEPRFGRSCPIEEEPAWQLRQGAGRLAALHFAPNDPSCDSGNPDLNGGLK